MNNGSFSRHFEDGNGIYIVCSDKNLLDKINTMLKRQGIVGVTDGEGRLHYMIDARKNTNNAVRQVNEFVKSSQEHLVSNPRTSAEKNIASDILEESIDDVMNFYCMDKTLMGTKVVVYLLRHAILFGGFDKRNVKELYLAAGWDLNLTYAQIERNVRYAFSKSKFKGVRMKTLAIMEILLESVRLELKRRHITADAAK